MSNVVIYLTPICPYCNRARRLLEGKGVEYTIIDVARDTALRDEMERRSGRETVPQIFIDHQHIGGFDDMAALDLDGELDKILGLA